MIIRGFLLLVLFFNVSCWESESTKSYTNLPLAKNTNTKPDSSEETSESPQIEESVVEETPGSFPSTPASTNPTPAPVVEEAQEPTYNINDHRWFEKLQTGDVIFIQGTSSQTESIIEATNSRVTHMGFIVIKSGQYFVAEAVEPVKETPLEKFILPVRVKNNQLMVKRLDDSKLPVKLTPMVQKELIQEFSKYKGKHYDGLFQWSDNKIYCSELVFKIYKKVLGIDIGNVVFSRELNISSRVVLLIKKRFNVSESDAKFNRIYDQVMNEKIITPVSMFESSYFYKKPVVDFSGGKFK